jgi:galactose mutarotase-like enzyme
MSEPTFSNSPQQLGGESVRSVRVPAASDCAITEFSFAPGLGAATTALRARIDDREIDVFPPRDLAALDQIFPKDRNAPFRELNSPLFPNANRLLPTPTDAHAHPGKLGDEFVAVVEGVRVRMPLNHCASRAGAIPHQLHGLLFDRRAKETHFSDAGTARAVSDFHAVLGGRWSGEADVRVEQEIRNGVFLYSIEAKNVGPYPIPVGFGSHPYFRIPSGDPASARIVIPSRRRANIDDFDNVLPDGTFSPVGGDPFDFNAEAPGKIERKYLDSYFVLDPAKPRAVELRDRSAGITYRMVALTSNIIGAQVYYPGKGDTVALELVTHHPDPRKELWKDEPTGMQLLAPGESARYAYQIEVLTGPNSVRN